MIDQLRSVLSNYKNVERHIYFLIGAEFFLQLINSSFFLLLNYFLEKEGFPDYRIAELVGGRFLAVMLLATPLGFLIRGKKLKPFFLVAAISMPLISLTILFAAEQQNEWLLNWSIRLWGCSFVFMQVTALPFILLNSKKENHSEAISMFFQTWSTSIFLVGILNFILNGINPEFFDEKRVLQFFSILGFVAVWFILKIDLEEKKSAPLPFRQVNGPKDIFNAFYDVFIVPYDWKLIIQAATPTLIIAIGAGFTIPVINLFFLNVHGVESRTFSLLGASTFLLVAVGMTFMPVIKRRYGYMIAITLFQSLAVIALLMLVTTEYYRSWEYALPIAIFFYIIRQPLMNVAGPMTSELTLYYVGKRNQEMISALNASIWSGSWFISMEIFAFLRRMEWRYVSIFLITVVLYIFGILWYVYLIKTYEQREAEKRLESSV
ncbi:MAG: hypothetical protein AAF502_13835 [Bacteroidota bacterium]